MYHPSEFMLRLASGRSTLFRAKTLPLLLGLVAIGDCTVAPTGPALLALPPAGKDLNQFQREDVACRGYAEQQIGFGAQQQASDQSAIGSAAASTAVGAAAGAAIGAAAGGAGTGAAVGAGAGLLAGSALGTSNASASTAVLQQRYDFAYAQCMAADGNQVQPFPLAMLYAPYGYPLSSYWPYYGPGPSLAVGFGFLGRFGPRFHHHAFFRHGFHRR
jgi:hypothetical protein